MSSVSSLFTCCLKEEEEETPLLSEGRQMNLSGERELKKGMEEEKTEKKVEKEKETDQETKMKRHYRAIEFEAFKKHHCLPRYPDLLSTSSPLSSSIVSFEEIDRDSDLVIFVSHVWTRGAEKQPDDLEDTKKDLLNEAVEKTWKTLAPFCSRCFLWLDWSCMDQDGNPAGELMFLDQLVGFCDLLLTPLPGPSSAYSTSAADPYDSYDSLSWNGADRCYLSRAWCRVEMFFGANVPVSTSTSKLEKFRFGLRSAHEAGRRPHLLYSVEEKRRKMAPFVLPPLMNTFFEKYHPEKGSLSFSQDMPRIRAFVQQLLPRMSFAQESYEGQRRKRKRKGEKEEEKGEEEGEGETGEEAHGIGVKIYQNGDIYSGEWKSGKRHGFGCLETSEGNLYEGEWVEDRKSGSGRESFADGGEYLGGFRDGKWHGQAKEVFSNGNWYLGEWVMDKKEGNGSFYYVEDDLLYSGEWLDDQRHGIGSLVKGEKGDGSVVYQGRWVRNSPSDEPQNSDETREDN